MSSVIPKQGISRRTVGRGWVMVIAGFVIWTVVFGVQNSFGIFFKPLQETFGWSRTTTSWVITVHLIVYGLSMMPGGWAMPGMAISSATTTISTFLPRARAFSAARPKFSLSPV